MSDSGRSPAEAGSGLRPFGAEPAAQSQAKPLVPNAGDIAAALKAVSENAMYRGGGFGSPYSVAQALGLLEEHEVQKPCRSCGHPQHDYSYSTLTLAGKAYLSLALAQGIVAATAGETEGLDERSEQSPVLEEDAPK